jgi:hypothetical protein
MKFGIHSSSWLDTPDPAEAFVRRLPSPDRAFFSSRFSSMSSATASFNALASRRRSLTSSEVAARAVSPARHGLRGDFALRFVDDSPLEGADLPPMIKQKKRGGNPARHPVQGQDLQGKSSTVLALSRTLCAGSADAAAFAAASLTATARGALPGGRSGRRDGGFRSNKGMGGGCSRGGGVSNLVAGVE